MADPRASGGRRNGAAARAHGLPPSEAAESAAHRAADVIAAGLCVLGAISPLALAYGLVAWQAGMTVGLGVLLGVAAVLTAGLLVVLLWPRRRSVLPVDLAFRCPHCHRPAAVAPRFRSLDGLESRVDTFRHGKRTGARTRQREGKQDGRDAGEQRQRRPPSRH